MRKDAYPDVYFEITGSFSSENYSSILELTRALEITYSSYAILQVRKLKF